MCASGPFASPDNFVAIPRVAGLALAPAGDRLVAAVSQLDPDRAAFRGSLWSVDPDGVAPARRLTRSGEGESAPAYQPDGSLLFLSARPRPPVAGEPSAGGPDEPAGDPDGAAPEPGAEAPRPACWRLPAAGGEPELVAELPGGVTGVLTARCSPAVVLVGRSAPGGPGPAEDRAWWAARQRRKASAVLHESLPVRHWDHHLGPDEAHLYAVPAPVEGRPAAAPRDLTPDAGQALHEAQPVLTPDGSTVLTEWLVPRGRSRTDLVAVDVATGSRRVLAAAEDDRYDFAQPQVSPDGRLAVAVRHRRGSVDEPAAVDLWVVELGTGAGRALDLGDGPTVAGAVFAADGAALLVVADEAGHRPLFRLALDTGAADRLTPDGSWACPAVAPDGRIFGLAAAVDRPPRPARLDLAGGAVRVADLDAPGRVGELPGRLAEVDAVAADGTALRAWLVLPAGAGPGEPAPLVVWVHGGPLSSWNDWHWRWNPWVMAARGWAVLLPDPALSTGYGAAMVRRGWGQWGGAPYTDVLALTDAALRRDDLDPGRTALMGGSYGGYLANWTAGHTDRFRAIVSHASLWSLEQFQATTDWPELWAEEWGYPATNPELYRTWSPDRYADDVRTPMLVTHGERDYRCPVGESLRLWTDLTRRGVDCQFLWFGAENHWVLQPADSVIWYETVLAFLDRHVLDRPWQRPGLL